MEYSLPNGETWKELRLPDEVQRGDSLATLSGAPVTEGHHGMITPDNVGEHQVGYVSGNVKHNSRLVQGDLVIQQRKTIQGIEKGDFKEVSAGYSCDLEFAEGEFQGERYDAIQRNIVYNHVAIGPSDWARGGSELSLHLDSKDEHSFGIASRLDSNEDTSGDPPVKETQKQRGKTMKKMIKLDGMPFEVEIPDSIAPTFEAALEKALEAPKESNERLDSLQGELDAAKTKVTELEKKLNEAKDPAQLDKAVKARVQLVQDCKKLHPEIETDGKEERDLKIEALDHAGHKKENFDGKSDGYLDGYFLAQVAHIKDEPEEEIKGVGVLPVRQDSPKEKREDGIDPYDSEAARQRMIERNQELCKAPE